MKAIINVPYSQDSILVETEKIPTLFDLPVVRISLCGRRLALTPDDANILAHALWDASAETNPSATQGIR